MHKVKYIPLRIRREYFKIIVTGEKTVEYRKWSDYWRKRLRVNRKDGERERIAVFICGKDVHRRWIREVHHMETPADFSEQGREDVDTSTCFAIYLGSVARRPRCCPRCGSEDIGELDSKFDAWASYTSEEYEQAAGRWYCVSCGWAED